MAQSYSHLEGYFCKVWLSKNGMTLILEPQDLTFNVCDLKYGVGTTTPIVSSAKA
jgi:hypothetical protein